MDILGRVQELCTENNITIKQLERDLGFSTSSIRRWTQSSPAADRLVKVANYFGVSVDYLTGGTDIRTPIDKVLSDDDIITIQRARENMSDEDRMRMMKMIRVCFDYAFEEGIKEYDLKDLVE